MKLRLALAALLLACLSTSAAIVSYRSFHSTINLSQAVKLPDGKILPAGLYDVEIEYKGFGNAAQFHFFKGKSPVATLPAEARGFPSSQPSAGKIASDEAPKEQKVQKVAPADASANVADKTAPLTDKWPGGAPGAQEFSWGAFGFTPGLAGKSAPAGQSVKISFDSSNSAAGFQALLPAAPKGK